MLELKKKVGRKGVSKEVALQMQAEKDHGYSLASIGKTHGLHPTNVSRTLQRLKDGKYD